MALVDNAFYVNYGNGSSTGYFAVTAWAALTAYAAGTIRKQVSPSAGNERTFICIIAGTSLVSEPSWTLTRGAKTAEAAGPTWQECTGIAAINGDATNTPNWTTIKNTSVSLGQVIKRDNSASYQICSTAGTAGNGAEPGFSDTAGTTTADNTVTWTSLGVVGNFTGWQAPHARCANAVAATWAQADNSLFFASEHAETQATANSITFPGTVILPNYCYSVNKNNVPPTSANVVIGASIATTGASALSINGSVYMEYMTLLAGSGSSNASLSLNVTPDTRVGYKGCILGINNSHASSRINLCAATNNYQIFTDCEFRFGDNTSQGFTATLINSAKTKFYNNTFTFSTNKPSVLFLSYSRIDVTGCDFSGFPSGNILFSTPSTVVGDAILSNCKLAASATICGSILNLSHVIHNVLSDNAGNITRVERYSYYGIQTTETTIVRTNGASTNGTPVAIKIVTNSNTTFTQPFTSTPLFIKNTVTGSSVTVTVYGIWSDSVVPNNDDIWIECVYLGDGSTPMGTIKSSAKTSGIATAAAYSSDSSTWGGSTTAFKMTVTLTSPNPALVGNISVVVKAVNSSNTFYIDNKPVLS